MDHSRQTLKQKLASERTLLGTWSQCASPEILEIIGYSGFDFTIIDTEHGFFGLETAENLVRTADAANISPIVRVMVNEPALIMKALDMGAQGVIVPQVTTRAEAEKAIAAARYYPEGSRGACPCIRAGQHYVTEWARYATKANQDSLLIALVEGKTRMANMQDIITTPGLDAVMIGPFDLSVALGVGGQLDHPMVIDYVKQILSLCQAHHVHLFVPNFDLDMSKIQEALQTWKALGARIFTVGTDKLFFAHYMNTIHGALR